MRRLLPRLFVRKHVQALCYEMRHRLYYEIHIDFGVEVEVLSSVGCSSRWNWCDFWCCHLVVGLKHGRESGGKCISGSFVKGGFPEVRGDEFENEKSNETEEFFPTSDDFEDYLPCDMNVLTSEISTLSDLIDTESDSSGDDQDDNEGHGIHSAKEAIQSLKIVKAFLSNSEGQEKSLQKLICIENAIFDVADKNKTQSPGLKVIATMSVGHDHIDLEDCRKR
ncbi:hypothetical protein AVEN_95205-1 [Araneus ventricosus]|uniref:Uncharacterized protein n=1 Tax=Araneus ventricosus TaxID=182803 RepID=A0A4Y2J902_ARAVE|nr:hypothetical protein AVEN_95205-1 [Araneus ventricosus]